jgi:DNA helicase-2/ATP-dependent DNA helicase PcrA
MELPRGEMDVVGAAATHQPWEDDSQYADIEDVHEEASGDTSWDADLDDSFDVDVLEQESTAKTPVSTLGVGPLTTAAELHRAETAAPAPVPPEAFIQGMVVRHPSYGLGKIVALSGSRERRTATVAFASTAGEKKFVLASSPLRPAKGN